MSTAHVLVLDCSGSMYGAPFEHAKVCAYQYAETLPAGDVAAVITADHRPTLVATLQPISDTLLRTVLQLQNNYGGTDLCAALRFAQDVVRPVVGAARRIVVFTDGFDNQNAIANLVATYASEGTVVTIERIPL